VPDNGADGVEGRRMFYILPSWNDLIVNSPQLLIPLWQVLLFVLLVSVAALFRRYRWVLVCSYGFALYWVFVQNLRMLEVNRVSIFSVIFLAVFGLLGFVLIVYHMVTSRD